MSAADAESIRSSTDPRNDVGVGLQALPNRQSRDEMKSEPKLPGLIEDRDIENEDRDVEIEDKVLKIPDQIYRPLDYKADTNFVSPPLLDALSSSPPLSQMQEQTAIDQRKEIAGRTK